MSKLNLNTDEKIKLFAGLMAGLPAHVKMLNECLQLISAKIEGACRGHEHGDILARILFQATAEMMLSCAKEIE